MSWTAAFARETSEIDWCEPNYVVSSHIAEFFNTISNVLFFAVPPLLFSLFRSYAQCVTSYVNVVWALFVVVGVGSTYFHATLSLAGQLIDEFAILWVFNAALALWMPKRFLPAVFREHVLTFQIFMGVFTVCGTLLCCIYPKINAFVMICFGVPTAVLLVKEINRSSHADVRALGRRCLVTWAVAVTIWLSDRLQCSFWLTMGFPYLHSIWHLLVFICSYQACVLFAFFDTEAQYPELVPVLGYWPADKNTWVGLPLLRLQNALPLQQSKRPCMCC